MRKSTAVATLAFATVIGLTGCSAGEQSSETNTDCTPAHEFTTISPGLLTVSMYDFPPITLYNDGDPEGVDVDILKEVADRECITIEWVNNSPAANIPSVQSGRADIALGAIYRTAERAEVVSLSDPIYTDSMALISEESVSDLESAKTKEVGMVGGYLWVEDMNSLLGDSVRVYQNSVEMYTDLETGRLDIAVDGLVSANYLYPEGSEYKVQIAKPHPDVAATELPAQIAIVSTLDNQDLSSAINGSLEEMRSDGTFSRILTEHSIDEAVLEVGEPRLIE